MSWRELYSRSGLHAIDRSPGFFASSPTLRAPKYIVEELVPSSTSAPGRIYGSSSNEHISPSLLRTIADFRAVSERPSVQPPTAPSTIIKGFKCGNIQL